jgi:hypothetical protein
MRKIAIFTEGQSELIFVRDLLLEPEGQKTTGLPVDECNSPEGH